jgi:aspartyl-tRNA(Asn)/glutamyl-tRNA(Gln) amidotransferase subunit B
VARHGVGYHDAWQLVLEPDAQRFYEQAVAGANSANGADGADATAGCSAELKVLLLNWTLTELFAVVRASGSNIYQCGVSPAELRILVELIAAGSLSGRMAKEVFAAMASGDTRGPAAIVAARGLAQISDVSAVSTLCAAVVAENADKAAAYRAGRKQLLGFFIGQVMKLTNGQANPQQTQLAMLSALKDADGGHQ